MANRLPAPYRQAVLGLVTEVATFLGFLAFTAALAILFALAA